MSVLPAARQQAAVKQTYYLTKFKQGDNLDKVKVLVLYRPNSDHGRLVDDFINNFKSSGTSGKIEAVNIDTREGSATAVLYDVTRYPAVLVLRDDGIIQHLWEGLDLPLVNEVVAYISA